MNLVRFVPKPAPRWDRDAVLARLSTEDVAAIYHELGVRRLKSGGPNDYKAFVPWRNNVHDEAMTINRVTGVWSDKGLDEGGSIFDAVMRAGRARAFPEAVEWVANYLRLTPEAPAGARALRSKTPYSYVDESGALLYQVVREDYVSDDGELSKDFYVQRLVAGEWVRSLGDVRRVLLDLPDLVNNPTLPVYLVEGEKCQQAAKALGLLATTWQGGSNAWRAEYAGLLVGRDVVILPDQDEPGHKVAAQIAASLAGKARSVRVVELPDLGPVRAKAGRDICDWIEAGHERAELDAAVAATPEYAPPPPKTLLTPLRELMRQRPERPPQMIQSVWEPNSFGMIVAGAKSFKGFFVVDMLCSLAASVPFLGWPEFAVPEPKRVVYWMEEGAIWDVLRRVERWAQARGVAGDAWQENVRVVYGHGLRLTNAEGMALLRDELQGFAPDLVICDTLARVSAGMNENAPEDMGLIIDALDAIRRDYNTAVCYVHHENRAGQGVGRGHSSLYAACDCIARLERQRAAADVKITIELKSGDDVGTFWCDLVDAPPRPGERPVGVLMHRGHAVRGVDHSQFVTAHDIVAYLERHGSRAPLATVKKDLGLTTDDLEELLRQLARSGDVLKHAEPPGPRGGRPLTYLVLAAAIGDDDA